MDGHLNPIAQTMPLNYSETLPMPLVQQIPEVQAMPVQSALILENQAPQAISVAQSLPTAHSEIQPLKEGNPILENHLNSVVQQIALEQPLPVFQPILETCQMPLGQNCSDGLPIPAAQTISVPLSMPVHQEISEFPPNFEKQPIATAQPLPVAYSENQLKQMLQLASEAQQISADQMMAVKHLLSVVHPISVSHPLQASQTFSEAHPITQTLPLHNAELQPMPLVQQTWEVQPVPGTLPIPVKQIRSESQPILENQAIQMPQNISVAQPLQVETQLNHVQPPLSKVLPVSETQTNTENQLKPVKLPLPVSQPMAVAQAMSSDYSESQPISVVQPMPVANQVLMPQEISNSQAKPSQEIQPITVVQPNNTDQSDSIAQYIPVNQTQTQPIVENQPESVKPTIKTFATHVRWKRPLRKAIPIRRPNKSRRPNPAQLGNSAKVKANSLTQRMHIRIPRISFNMGNIDKIKLAKECISIFGTILLLFAVWAVWRLHSAYSAKLPSMTCPKYFQYLSEDDTFYGKMTLFNLTNGAIHVELMMQQQQSLNSDFIGDLTLYEDLETSQKTFKYNKSITYRVNFPHNNELPQVLSITVNGIQICSGIKYSEPGSEVKLTHSFFPAKIPVAAPKTHPLAKGPSDQQNNFGEQAESHKANTTAKKVMTHPLTSTQSPSIEPRFGAPAISTAKCGRVQIGTIPLIFGGIVLRRGEMPWLVAIYRKHYTGLQFICGGSLISARTVLTAGHCLRLYGLKAEQVLTYLGRYNLENYNEDGAVAREIARIMIHPDYEVRTFPDADLALLQMQLPVSFNDYIQPICLWSGSEHDSFLVNQTGAVAGWGADESGHGISATPKMVETEIVSEAECLRSSEVFRNLTSKRTICAGRRDGTGPCMGDSGGGLMIKRDGRWMIRGIVSAGQTKYQTCNLHEFVIYCDLAKHMIWVQSNLLN